MIKFLKQLYYSFPVQLLIHQLKNDHLTLFIWLYFFGMIGGVLGVHYGTQYVFLDPEYLGQVNFLSFFWIGLSLGIFIITYNITCYITSSRSFPFLASFETPFLHFSINNFIIPLAFVLFYSILIIRFQFVYELKIAGIIFFRLAGMLCGVLIIFLLTALYFHLTNTTLLSILKNRRLDEKYTMTQPNQWSSLTEYEPIREVKFFLSKKLKVRIVRDVSHYDKNLLLNVFQKQHKNALFIQLGLLALLAFLGFFIDFPVMQFPAGASIFLLCSMIVVVLGAASYWLGTWRVTLFLVIIVIANFLTGYDFFSHKNEAFGINYNIKPAVYNNETIEDLSNTRAVEQSKNNSINILNNWKAKTGLAKPNLVITNCSGGGISAGFWAMLVLQHLDSLSNGKFMQHTALMTGASGGIYGTAYYRDLYLQNLSNKAINYNDKNYAVDVVADFLNPVIFTFVVNDIFLPFQRYQVGKHYYIKDRAYAFEQKFNRLTDFCLNKPLSSYHDAEKNADIPMMMMAATIMNDKRRMLFAAQPVNYLTCMPTNKKIEAAEIDAIDFNALFKNHDGDKLLTTSAIRMNGTFPLIFPSVFLPTEPVTEIMDAGLLDNNGFEITYRFLYRLKDWLLENVNEIIVVDIRSYPKIDPIEDHKIKRLLQKASTPFSVYDKWGLTQDYEHDNIAALTNEILNNKLRVIILDYQPNKEDAKVSMSLHLTEKEKVAIKGSLNRPAIMRKFEQIKMLLEESN